MTDDLQSKFDEVLSRVIKLEAQQSVSAEQTRNFEIELRSSLLQIVAFIERKNGLVAKTKCPIFYRDDLDVDCKIKHGQDYAALSKNDL